MEQIRQNAEENARCFFREAEEGGDDIWASVSETHVLEESFFNFLDPGILAHFSVDDVPPVTVDSSLNGALVLKCFRCLGILST